MFCGIAARKIEKRSQCAGMFSVSKGVSSWGYCSNANTAWKEHRRGQQKGGSLDRMFKRNGGTCAAKSVGARM